MKLHSSSLALLSVGLLSLPLLNSCGVTTSAGLLDKASYKAAVNMADLKPGDKVYADGEAYYVELPRYRADVPLQIYHMWLADLPPQPEKIEATGGLTLVQIPQHYALYLTGQGKPSTESIRVQVVEDDAEKIKERSEALTLVRTPAEQLERFQYVSPAAAGWTTLAALDFVCVDLPLSCVGTAVSAAAMVTGFAVGIAASPVIIPVVACQEQNVPNSSSSSGGGGGDPAAAAATAAAFSMFATVASAAIAGAPSAAPASVPVVVPAARSAPSGNPAAAEYYKNKGDRIGEERKQFIQHMRDDRAVRSAPDWAY